MDSRMEHLDTGWVFSHFGYSDQLFGCDVSAYCRVTAHSSTEDYRAREGWHEVDETSISVGPGAVPQNPSITGGY
jgi:hypothetical protein